MPDQSYPKTDFARLAADLERRRTDVDGKVAPQLRALREEAEARREAERTAEERQKSEARALHVAVRDARKTLLSFAKSPEAARIATATGRVEFPLSLTGASPDCRVYIVVGREPHLRVWHRGAPPYTNLSFDVKDATELADKSGEDARRALVEGVRSGAVWAAIASEALETDIEKTLLARLGVKS